MISFLKNHPFAVEAYFQSSIVLTFAVPKEDLLPLIPECLALDTYDDEWGFIAVALVQTKNLRPKGFPRKFGNDFYLIGYRIFVRYVNNAGKRLRGLYIIKSETNKKKMEFLGNIFTKYRYTTTDIKESRNGEAIKITSAQSGLDIEVEASNDEISLPEGSLFNNWREARKFSGPLPFTFSYNKEKRKVLIIEGVRQNWHPTPVKVISYNISFLKSLKLPLKLANAFIIKEIPYWWKKGKIEQCNR